MGLQRYSDYKIIVCDKDSIPLRYEDSRPDFKKPRCGRIIVIPVFYDTIYYKDCTVSAENFDIKGIESFPQTQIF